MSYYALRLSGVYDGQTGNPFYNMFTYLTTEISPSTVGAAALSQAFIDAFIESDVLGGVLSDLFVFQDVYIVSPPVPTVLSVQSAVHAGLLTGDDMPKFVALEWKSPRTVANIRQGKKRFGVTTEAVVTNGVLDAAFVDDVALITDALSEVLTATVLGVGVNFTPIIVKRVPYVTEGGNTAYRLPEGLDPFNYSVATDWAYDKVSTQNSRKS